MAASLHISQLHRVLLQFPPVEWALQRLKELLLGALRQGPVPEHVAFVMDGNRRFARKNRIEIVDGHNMGFEALAKVLLRSCSLPRSSRPNRTSRPSKYVTRLASELSPYMHSALKTSNVPNSKSRL
jgi:undecaprenyl pyrophosphate synthase